VTEDSWIDRLTDEELRRVMAMDRAAHCLHKSTDGTISLEITPTAEQVIEAAEIIHGWLFGARS
jgi:hypothetical protein